MFGDIFYNAQRQVTLELETEAPKFKQEEGPIKKMKAVE